MKITETVIDNFPILMLEGRLDSGAAPALEKSLREAAFDGRSALFLDLSAVDFASGAGLRSLILGARLAKSRRLFFAVCGLAGQPADMVELGDLTDDLNPRPNPAAAIRELYT